MWAVAVTRSAWCQRAEAAAARVRAGRARYEAVARAIGCPWQVVGVVDHLESGCNPRTHLHNGDRLSRGRTTHVPRGRPLAAPADKRRYTWAESALDALRLKSWHLVAGWPVERQLYELERYNGWGYLGKGVNSPYLWSGTTLYGTLPNIGKYVADGVWSSTAISKQVGAAAILKILYEEEEQTMTGNGETSSLGDYLEQFANIAPVLVAAIAGGKYLGVAGMALTEALEAKGKTVDGRPAAIVQALDSMRLTETLDVLREVEKLIKGIVPSAHIESQPPVHEVPVLAVEPPPQPEPTVLDRLLGGQALMGVKTYLSIAAAVVVNVMAALHVAPGALTPENVSIINIALLGAGGASLVSKFARYADLALKLLHR